MPWDMPESDCDSHHLIAECYGDCDSCEVYDVEECPFREIPFDDVNFDNEKA